MVPSERVVWEAAAHEEVSMVRATRAVAGEGGHRVGGFSAPGWLAGPRAPFAKGNQHPQCQRRPEKLQSLGFALTPPPAGRPATQLQTQEKGHIPDPDPAMPLAEGRAQPSPLGPEELPTQPRSLELNEVTGVFDCGLTGWHATS